MIRWLFALLILANLAIFLWGAQGEVVPQKTSDPARTDVPPVLLVEEIRAEVVEEKRPVVGGEPAPAPAVQQASPADAEPPLELAARGTRSGSGRTTGEAQDRRSPNQRAGAMAGPWAGSLVDPAPVDQARVGESKGHESSPENLGRADDYPGEEGAVSSPIEQEQARAGDGSVTRCYAIGAFDRREDAEKAIAVLPAQITAAGIRQETIENQIGYWVLINQQRDREQSMDKVAALKAAGLSDVWRFTRGPLANAISLGLFSRVDQAERHRDQVAAKGFAAEVEPRYVEETVFWIDLSLSSLDPAEDTWRSIKEVYPDVELVEKPCP